MEQQGRKRVSLHVVDLRDQYDLPIRRGIKPATVDDRDSDSDRQVLLFRQIRGDPLGEMNTRGAINDVELHAGRQWQRRYEIAYRGDISGTLAHPHFVQVRRFDGGNIGDRQLDAARWLDGAKQALGADLHRIIHDVCGDGQSLRQIAAACGLTEYRVRKLFHEAIEILTEFCRLATRKAA